MSKNEGIGLKSRVTTISILIIVMMLINACMSKNDIPVSTAQPHPDSVDLLFNPVEMQSVTEGKLDKSWELLKVIPFGEIDHHKVEIYTYHVPKKAEDLFEVNRAFIKFQEKYYLINDPISNDLAYFPQYEHSTVFLLQHTFSYLDNQLVMIGGIEVEANGPGRVDYLMYDLQKKTWFIFSDWGKPQFIDLDSDGEDEFVIQFEGLHLAWPDVIIYNWNKGKLEVSQSLKQTIMGDESIQSFANLEANKTIAFGEVRENGSILHYSYHNKKLIKQ
ncbi:hypothetical protein EHS13_18550 [Paenibacillus psychroresistens]|uniref:Uncharacterized protein n=1 Tax=Paenibacillus psychroresistens TaxID=1778678 RepID=A0A6B8RMX9_9BACL|nr:hypothetical protein [Paenibacillus psychroresistens]QGQ96736.1 hypothetical protein EHS13_18550 [Paenibacillus psychroresistens]